MRLRLRVRDSVGKWGRLRVYVVRLRVYVVRLGLGCGKAWARVW